LQQDETDAGPHARGKLCAAQHFLSLAACVVASSGRGEGIQTVVS